MTIQNSNWSNHTIQIGDHSKKKDEGRGKKELLGATQFEAGFIGMRILTKEKA